MEEDPYGPLCFLIKGNGSSPPEEIDDHNLIEELQYGDSSWAVEWRSRNYSSGFPDHQQLAKNSEGQHQHPPPPNYVLQFILKYYAEAQKIAAQPDNGVTAAEVLAISGSEST
jgi:hypothetical protein